MTPLARNGQDKFPSPSTLEMHDVFFLFRFSPFLRFYIAAAAADAFVFFLS